MKLGTPTVNKTFLDAADIASLKPEAQLEQRILSGDGIGLRAPNVSIEESVLERALLIEARLEKLGLRDVELKEVAFEGCHMEKVEFGQSKIKQVDVRSSQLYDIRGWQSLKGLIIDSTQLVVVAPQLAYELGIVIKED